MNNKQIVIPGKGMDFTEVLNLRNVSTYVDENGQELDMDDIYYSLEHDKQKQYACMDKLVEAIRFIDEKETRENGISIIEIPEDKEYIYIQDSEGEDDMIIIGNNLEIIRTEFNRDRIDELSVYPPKTLNK